jgi:hypothetical protein
MSISKGMKLKRLGDAYPHCQRSPDGQAFPASDQISIDWRDGLVTAAPIRCR